jgi:hypothetical protein
MFMMRKIFEQKFSSDAEATTYLNSTGWSYVGLRGLLKKYHLYKGLWLDSRGEVLEDCELRLKKDGHVELFAEFNVNFTISTTSLPHFVWGSKEIYEFTMSQLNQLNEELRDNYGHHYFVEWGYSERKFLVRSLVLDTKSIGPTVSSFTNLIEAKNWAIANVNNQIDVK